MAKVWRLSKGLRNGAARTHHLSRSLRLRRYEPVDSRSDDAELHDEPTVPGLGIVGDVIEGITGFVGGLFIGIGKGVRGLGRAAGSMFRD